MRGYGPILTTLLLLGGAAASSAESARVINLYDAFGSASSLKKDWGYAALVEYGQSHSEVCCRFALKR